MPYLTMVWVWPPQTSISTHGRVTMRRISADDFLRERFVAIFVEVFHGGSSGSYGALIGCRPPTSGSFSSSSCFISSSIS